MRLLAMDMKILVVAVVTLAADVTSLPGAGVKHVRKGDAMTYVAAVLEYEPYNQWTEDAGGEIITLENAKIISEYAAEAKAQGADILVSPEYGIQSLEIHQQVPEDLFSITQYVPDPELLAVPCVMNANKGNFKAMKTLSCAALENQIYLVVDLAEASPCTPEAAVNMPFNGTLDTAYECPSSGYIYYNTQIVFDRSGTVIARYRKKNLFLEPKFKPGTESDEKAIFVTDFGVTFTLQICFDIAYVHPGLANVEQRGVKDVAMSTAWVDILPFLVAPSVQNGWARFHRVNLLVSGHHLPERAKLGSGIYRGFSDLKQDYVFDPDSGNRMIVSEVYSIATADGVIRTTRKQAAERVVTKADSSTGKESRRDHLFYYDDLSNYTHVVLAKTSEPREVVACHDDEICCSLTYTYSSNLTYSLLAYSGPALQGGGLYAMYVQLCALVWCKTDDINSCTRIDDGFPPPDEFGSFTLSGNFTSEYPYSTLFTRNFTLVENSLYSVTKKENVYTLSTLQNTNNLMTGGFYARWYDRDPSAASAIVPLTALLQLLISLSVGLWNLS